ncbi:MAG: cobalt-precorrin-5B (C(1))-methyltransferase CbiD [Lentihominibacter sp.]
MGFEHYIRNGQKMLRLGYTSGTCAALASAGASELLVTGRMPDHLSIMTAKGIDVTVEPEDFGTDENSAWCAVTKDGGDDADVTHGLRIYARAEKCSHPGIVIDGGEGVGRVTKPGLDQPPGNAAINSVPRSMIRESVGKIIRKHNYNGGIKITIYVPGGENIAKKTFNPMLGIEGGISILGTTGIVEPMSNQALIDTIEVEIRQAAETGDRVILTPGNYGSDYINGAGMDTKGIPVIRISNFLGEAIDIAVSKGFREILLISHIGKLVKVAAGVMLTHSRYADCRREVFCSHSAVAGAEQSVCRALMEAATTDGCIEILDKAGLREEIMNSVLRAVQSNIQRRAGEEILIGAVTFSNVYGKLGETEEAGVIIKKWNVEDTTA